MASDKCCVPAPPSVHSSAGSEESWEGIHVYVNWPPTSTAAVILISDVFGWEAPLLRKLADKVAAAGFVAVVPDLLYGDSYDSQKHSNLEKWLPDHQPDGKPVEDAKKLATVLSSKKITSIGYSGFCWGAKVAIVVAKESFFKAAVLCHPSFLTIDDARDCAAPLAILAAENDRWTPPEVLDELNKKKDNFVKVFPGASHGWTIRYDVNDEAAVRKAEEAHRDFLAWFHKHLG